MPRLPLIDPDSAPDSIREIVSRTPLSLFRMVAHAESAFEPWLRFGATLLGRLELDPLLRELAILQVAHLTESRYEWVQHDPIARSVGASGEQVAAIEQGREDGPAFSETERMVLRFSREVILSGAAREQEVGELAALLGTRQVVELLLVLGQYLAIARLIATTGLEPDPPVPVDRLSRGRTE